MKMQMCYFLWEQSYMIFYTADVFPFRKWSAPPKACQPQSIKKTWHCAIYVLASRIYLCIWYIFVLLLFWYYKSYATFILFPMLYLGDVWYILQRKEGSIQCIFWQEKRRHITLFFAFYSTNFLILFICRYIKMYNVYFILSTTWYFKLI